MSAPSENCALTIEDHRIVIRSMNRGFTAARISMRMREYARRDAEIMLRHERAHADMRALSGNSGE